MISRETAKNIFSFIFRAALSAVLLAYIFRKIDWQKTWDVLRTAHPGFILGAGGIFLFINILLLGRWLIFIKALGVAARFQDLVRYHLAGLFGNLFLPSSIGGDFIKIYGLCRNSSQKTRVIASVLLDRLSGFAAIILVAAAAFVFGHRLLESRSIGWMMTGIIAVSTCAGAVLFNEKIYRFFCRMFSRLPRFQKALMDLHYDIALMKARPREGLQALGLSCLSQVIYSVCWYLIARGLDQDVGFIYFLIFVPLTCVAASFPSIGGLGVREVGTVYFFGKVGMDAGIAAGISLINFLLMVVVGLAGGCFYVFTLPPGRVQYHSSGAGAGGGDASTAA